MEQTTGGYCRVDDAVVSRLSAVPADQVFIVT